MRSLLASAAVTTVLWAGSAAAVTIPVTLSQDQFYNLGQGTIWRWTLQEPIGLAADGNLELDLVFENGVLRLGDNGAPPNAAQQAYRASLLDRLSTQKALLAKAQADITQITADLTLAEQKKATAFTKVQQKQADVDRAWSELESLNQDIRNLLDEYLDLGEKIETARTAVNDARGAVTAFLEEHGGFIGELLSAAFDALNDAVDAALDVFTGYVAEQNEVAKRIVQTNDTATDKQKEHDRLKTEADELQSDFNSADQEVSQLQTQKDEADRLAASLPTFIAVTEQELAQLPEDERAEALFVTLIGPAGDPVPLFGQLILDVAGGNPAFTAPFFQGGHDPDGGTIFEALADLTPDILDIEGLRLVLDLYGKPGTPFLLNSLAIELRADRISIVYPPQPTPPVPDPEAGPVPVPTPVPEPATLALFAAGLAGLGALSRRRPPRTG